MIFRVSTFTPKIPLPAIFTPPTEMVVTYTRLVPTIVTISPVPAEVGEKEVIVGTPGVKLNPASDAVPFGAVMATAPAPASLPNTAVTESAPATKEAGGKPPKVTFVTSSRLVP